MVSKHTKGTWINNGYESDQGYLIQAINRPYGYASISGIAHVFGPNHKESLANAILIKAAPIMLETLRKIAEGEIAIGLIKHEAKMAFKKATEASTTDEDSISETGA